MTDQTSAIDPVCGMTVDSATTEHRSFYKIKGYNFCSRGCKETFDKGPEKFIGASAKSEGEGH